MFAADDFSAIAARSLQIRKERGLPDDNWRTAAGSELDGIAAFYALERRPYEIDDNLRSRVETEIRKKHGLL